jgi:MFS family permease
MTAILGTTMGTGVGAIMHASFTSEQLADWAWRIPFLCGILLGGMLLGFEQEFTLKNAIEFHVFAPLKALSCLCPIAFLSGVHFLTG